MTDDIERIEAELQALKDRVAALESPERDPQGHCVRCLGRGVLPNGDYCRCPLGKDLERVERNF